MNLPEPVPHRGAGLLLAACLPLLLAGCTLLPAAPPPATVYDLGALPAPTIAALPTALRLQVAEPTAAPWLADTAMHYRLQFRSPWQREQYRDSRWAAAPAVLLAQRLRQRLAVAPCSGAEPAVLVLALDEFSQDFDTPASSQVQLRLRARLGAGPERAFTVLRPGAGADAPGAVPAYAAAVDTVIDELLAWARHAQPAAACR